MWHQLCFRGVVGVGVGVGCKARAVNLVKNEEDYAKRQQYLYNLGGAMYN